jgi:peptide/nickel transport system permease protein
MTAVNTQPESLKTALALFFKRVGKKSVKIWHVLFSNWQAASGTSILLFFIIVGFIGPLILPYNGLGDPTLKFSSPSLQHWFGCDYQGRDVLAMIVAGTKNIFAISLLTGVFTVVLGVMIGMISAMSKPFVDKILQLITNMFLTIPSFPILMMISAVITIRDNFTFALILALWSWPGLARAVRAQIISLKERDFIQICRVMKMSEMHIIFSELIPNIASYILINLIMIMRSAITSSVGIMFLGVAEMDPSNWGAMLYDIMNSGALLIDSATAYCLAPILTIALFQMGVVNLANGLDETLNPRLKKN